MCAEARCHTLLDMDTCFLILGTSCHVFLGVDNFSGSWESTQQAWH